MKLPESQCFRARAWGGAARRAGPWGGDGRTRRRGRCARDALPESAGRVSGTGGSGLSVNKGCRPLEASCRRGGQAGSWYRPPADPLLAPCPHRRPCGDPAAPAAERHPSPRGRGRVRALRELPLRRPFRRRVFLPSPLSFPPSRAWGLLKKSAASRWLMATKMCGRTTCQGQPTRAMSPWSSPAPPSAAAT